jgi:hypothetical protein
MKTLILAVMLATVTIAQAQQLNHPKTIVFTNNATGEKMGTATLSADGRIYFRDKTGEHYATMVREPDGTKTLYDPSGKVIDINSLNLPKLPESE